MARRTELQMFEVEVEEALEKAMNRDFGDAAIETISPNDSANLINVDDLIQKIATAEEEILIENDVLAPIPDIHNDAVVDESVVKQIFDQKSTHEFSGGTVHDTLLPALPLPANDDVTSPLNFGPLKQTSVSRIYWTTTAFSALWATGGAVVAHKLAPIELNSLANIISFVTSPTGLAVIAGTAIPILMSWGFAQLTKRSNELRNVAVFMINAAQRLGGLQNAPEKQAAVIGQTIREEVAAMNEEIERTLGRAVELEAIIQGEVNNLERAYIENESRIHTLIKGLNNERIAILNHADRVQSTIQGTQKQLNDEFGLVTSKIAANIEKFAQTLSQTLQKQGEDLVSKLSYAGDGTTNQLIEKFNETAEQIQQKNIEFFHKLGENFNNFSERFGDNEKQLEEAFKEMVVKAEMHIGKITTHIQTEADKTLSKVDEQFKTLDEAIVDRSNQSLQDFDEKVIKLDEKAYKLSSTFDNITSEAIKAFEDRLVTVDLSLKKHSDSIVESFASRSQALEDNAEKLGEFLENHISQIDANLREKTANIADVFTSGHDTILSAIDKSKEALKEEVKNVDNAVIDVIQERFQDFKSQLSDQRDLMADMLDGEKDKIADTMKHHIDTLTQNTSDAEKIFVNNIQIVNQHAETHATNIAHCTEKLQEVVTQSCETIKEAIEVQAQNIDIRADALRDSLAINSFSLNEVLAGQARTLEQRVETIHDLITKSDIHIDTALKQQMDFVESAIVNNNETITEAVQQHIKSFEDHTEILKNTLSQSSDTFFGALVNNNETITEAVQQHIKSFEDRTEILKNTLSQSSDTFFGALEVRIGSFDETLEGRTRQIFERADILEKTLSEKLGRVCDTIEVQTSIIGERSDDLKASIILGNEHSETIQKALEASVDDIRTTLGNSVDMVTDNVRNEAMRTSDVFSSTGEQMLLSLRNETDKVQERLVDISEKLALVIADQAKKSEDSILSISNKFISSFSDVASEAENVISESGNRIVTNVEQTVSEISEKVLSALAEQTTYTTEAFTMAGTNAQTLINEVVHTSTTAIEQLLNERSNILHQSMQEFKNNLGCQLADVSNCLEEARDQTTGQISEHVEHLAELTDYLNQAAQNTTESIEHLTQHVSKQLSLSAQEAEQRICAQNEALINTLTQTNSETVQTMNTVKKDIVDNISTIIEQLNQSTYNICENSNILISAVQNIDGQFSETANNFLESTNQVAENLSASGQALNSNVEILQWLSKNTFEQINCIMSKFSEHAQTLSEAVRALEQSENTLNVTLEEKQSTLSMLSDTLIAKSDEVSELIKHYENSLNLAFERTDKNTRDSTQLLHQTLNQLINESSARFSGATENIRRSADEIRLELSKINDDINQGVQALPEKTKETMDTVRHALNEQITALKDLASVVQNNSHISKKDPLTSVFSTPLTSSKNNASAPENIKKIVPPKPIRQQDQETVKPSKWVSNLLARASHEETLCEERYDIPSPPPTQMKPRTVSGSLNSLATDILNAVNHDAAVELWGNYQRGQKNIMIERLYSLNGKMIFEMVKKKYMSDANFRRSVNQYIVDFEKLLNDVSRKAKDTGLIQKYLVSNTGKVYTMLAHASGRIQ
ncbi:hypothetical protein BAnh1_05790 [Bartonella australis AUST/NH1]|uniref:Apolipoprotein A1/A4/E domain-containing protein n=1 Tax=Bartonella australis (strain Aust/NH1) TaxID=1094489 RepID=M1NT06_BARAA|nr:hypothetical protein [Bartonella australis]AGF74458.1 hypothetical protein BAnh1_05790 [Bartonella australis AUST/NH1]